MKRTIILIAAALLLTGCADSSSHSAENSPAATESQTEITQQTTEAEDKPDSTSESTTASTRKTESTASAEQTSKTEPSQSSQSGTTASQPAVTTASNTQSPSVTTTVQTAPVKSLLRELKTLSASGSICGVASAGGSKVYVEVGNGTGTKADCYLVDTEADSLSGSRKLTTSCETILGVSGSGELVTFNAYAGQIYFYTADTCVKMKVDPQAGDFSYDDRTDTICELTQEGCKLLYRNQNSSTIFQRSSRTDAIKSVSLPQGVVITSDFNRSDFSGVGLCGYSVTGGQLLYELPDLYSDVYFSGNSLLRTETHFDSNTNVSGYNLFAYDVKTGRETARFKLSSGMPSVFVSEKTQSGLLVTWNEKKWCPQEIILTDFSTGRRVSKGITLKNAESVDACYMEDTGKWLVAVTEKIQKKQKTRLMLIDPNETVLDSTFPAPGEFGSAANFEVGSALQPLRERAEQFEQRFGVRLLFGNECKKVQDYSYFRLESAEDYLYNYDNDPKQLREYTEKAFDFLEEQLGRYPAGFFDCFKHDNRAGLRIILTEQLPPDDDSSFYAGGVTFEGRVWYNIAINLNMLVNIADASIHHEIWHAVEDRLRNEGITFDDTEWNSLNPPKFKYTTDLDNYYAHPEYNEYILMFTLDPEKRYFSRDYSTVNAMEDRATLIERLFDPLANFAPEALTTFDSSFNYICSQPHLLAKLNVIAQKVNKLFGYVYFEQMLSGTPLT